MVPFVGRVQPERHRENRPLRQLLAALLVQPEQVRARDRREADQPRREVQHCVAVFAYSPEQLRDVVVRPASAEAWQDEAQHVGLGDGPVDVGDHHARVLLPEVNCRLHDLRALQRRGDGEACGVKPGSQVQRSELIAGGL